MRARRPGGEDRRQMRKKLTNNLGLKILSLFVAFIVWILVVNIDDPVISITYSGISVEMVNTDCLKTKGKTYEILNKSDNINVTITGKRSVVEAISKDNIKAVADMQNLTQADGVEIKLSSNKNGNKIESLKASHSTVKLKIEDLKVMHLQIDTLTTGNPANGYVVGDIAANQNTVIVSGPESVVSTVAKAQVEVDVSDRTSDITTKSTIVLYDNSGEIVDSKYLETNIDALNISVDILLTRDIDMKVLYHGEPENGYLVKGSPVTSVSKITIAGKKQTIEQISSVIIPESDIDITGQNEDYVTTYNLENWANAKNVKLVGATPSIVDITIPIEKGVTRTLLVPVGNIEIANLPAEYNAKIAIASENADTNNNADSQVKLRVLVLGIASDFSGVKGEDIPGKIDVKSYMEKAGVESLVPGSYKMEVELEMPEGLKVIEPAMANVTLENKTSN